MFGNNEKGIIEQSSRGEVTITLVIILFFSVTSATFAYFAFSESNNVTINGSSATVNLTLGVERIFPLETTENTGVLVPQLSTSASSNSPLASALKNGCVDSNANVVCHVYKITIQNAGGSATQVVDGGVSFYGNSAMTTDANTTMPNLKWKVIESADASTPSNSVLGTDTDKVANSDENEFVTDLTLATNDYYEYYIIVWINETGETQSTDPGNSFYGKVWFESSNGTGVTSTF